jgi:hypothetical protein
VGRTGRPVAQHLPDSAVRPADRSRVALAACAIDLLTAIVINADAAGEAGRCRMRARAGRCSLTVCLRW